MGHDHHFLERLDRASQEQIDVALSLYRDHEAVRFVLDHAKVPSEATRIAFCIDDAAGGPFVIVARDGHFVTCLAPGMSTGSHPVVGRKQLDALLDRHTDLRARWAMAKELARNEDDLEDVLLRIVHRADLLSREEFIAVSAWQPMLAPQFYRLAVQTSGDLETQRENLGRVGRAKPNAVPALEAYWKLLWSYGHHMLLAAMGDKELIARDAALFKTHHLTPTCMLALTGVQQLALRGAWVAAKIGKPLVGLYKRIATEARELTLMNDALWGLTAIGLRSTSVRAEVRKALGRMIHGECSEFVYPYV